MRLIDADKLKYHFYVQRYVHAYDIDKAPTVKAIPIEWLEMFMRRYKIEGNDEYKLLHFMVTEWEKWEKENEVNR